MSGPATAQAITIDYDVVREIAIDVGAMEDYLRCFFDDGSGPVARLAGIHHRLLVVMGIESTGDDEPPPETDLALEEMLNKEIDRGKQWLDEDRDAIYSTVGQQIAGYLRFFG